MLSNWKKLLDPDLRHYVLRSATWRLWPSLAICPSCGSRGTDAVGRKALVTKLVRCPGCFLLYRVPQEPRDWQERFYQSGYESSLATHLPSKPELAKMTARDFRGTEKDFSSKIAVLSALGAKPSNRVLDFGCSWGYGVWQLRAHGYEASGFEISRERALYGRERLGLAITDSLNTLKSGYFDFVFSNHVFEHLPDPAELPKILGRLLRPGGIAVAWFPNGSMAHREARPHGYHHSWGRLHAVYLDDAFLDKALEGYSVRLEGRAYGRPPDLESITAWNEGAVQDQRLTGPEMLMIVRKPAG